MKEVRISIITITFNSAHCIEETIKSVVSQEYSNLEYIIIDGGSKDGTLDIVRKYEDKIACIVSEPDSGISDAFNKGIYHATGDMIGIVNADDQLLPHALKAMAEAYEEETDIYRGNLMIWNPGSTEMFREIPSLEFSATPYFVHVAHGGTFVTKSAYQRFGGYDVNLRYTMDLDFLIRSFQKGAKIKYVNVDVAVFKTNGVTSIPIYKKRKEYIRLTRKNGANILQAYAYYLFLLCVDRGKALLDIISPDLKKKLHYRQSTKKSSLLTRCLLTLFCLCSGTVFSRIPIIAYYGIPPQYVNKYRFTEFREAGFDISFFYYGDTPVDTLLRFLDDAQASGIQLLMGSNHLDTTPDKTIKRLKDHPALFGYFLTDEPRPKDIERFKAKHTSWKKYDDKKPIYMNLLPNLGHNSLKSLGINDYTQYLKEASALGLQQISFDFYPITTTEGIRETWYGNLEAIRNESMRTKKPFWAFALSTPHAIYPQPTIGMLRLQVYSDLAYGAQAIQYFTYWTPVNDPEYDYYDGSIGPDGKKTKTYYIVQQMNRELKGLLPLFDGAQVVSVHHMVKIPEGTTRPTHMPTNIYRFKVKGAEGALLSTIKKDGHEYLAIVNKDYQNPLRIDLKAKSGVRQLTKRLEETPIKNVYEIAQGDILILKLR